MDNYFESEIERLKREILGLKKAQQKSAANVPTTAQSVSITQTLQLIDSGDPRATVHYKIETPSRALVFATLDKYYDDITLNDHRWNPDTRVARISVQKYSKLVYYISITYIGDGNDYITIRDGGTVTMTRTLTVRCTDTFTMTKVE